MSIENTPVLEQRESPLVEEIRMLMGIARKKLGHGFSDRQVTFAGQLREKYPDWKKRRAYHALVESTMPESGTDVIEEDFPGEDSVTEFLQSLIYS